MDTEIVDEYLIIKDNNIFYYMPPDFSVTKTYWHFKNYNIIMPNWLGFDIHNFKDDELNIEKMKDSLIIKKYMIYCDDIRHYYYIDSIYSKQTPILNNLSELKDDKIIFYVIYNPDLNGGKPRKVIVPLDIIPDSGEFDVEIDNLAKLLCIALPPSYRRIFFNIKNLNENFDISDAQKCIKMILEKEQIEDYINLLLGKI